jgi:predicted MFS family arabinose efflux permease
MHAVGNDHNKRLKVITAGICALILSVGIARFAYTPFLPLMLSQTDLTTFEGGWLATFNYIGYLFGVVLISMISDLRLKYQFYRLNLIIAVISTLAMGLTSNVWLWGFLRLIAGMSSTAGIILAAGFVMSWLKQHGYKGALGLHFSGLGWGIAIPGLAIVAMNLFFDWATQWLVMGLFGLVFFIPAWCWMPEPDNTQNQHQGSINPPSKRWMNLMVAAYFCAGVGYVISATFIVAILEHMPLLTGKGDWIWVLLGIAAIPSCFLWDKIAEKTSEIKALIACYSIMLMSIIIPALSDTLAMNLLGALMFGATFAGVVSLMLVFIGHKFPQNPAKAMARLTISYGIAQITAPAIAAGLSTRSGSYSSALWLAGGCMLTGILCLFLIWQEQNKQLNR